MIVRRIREEDAQTVNDLYWREVRRREGADRLPDCTGATQQQEELSRLGYEQMATHESELCFVAEEAGEIAGWIVCELVSHETHLVPEGRLHQPFVTVTEGREETARRLVEHAVDVLLGKKVDVIHAQVPADDGQRQQPEDFWTALGWRRDMVTYSWYAHGGEEDALHVRFASMILLVAVYKEVSDLELSREDGEIAVAADGAAPVPLSVFLGDLPEYRRDFRDEPVPVDAVFARFLEMAGIAAAPGRTGTVDIRMACGPPPNRQVTVSVCARTEDVLALRLEQSPLD